MIGKRCALVKMNNPRKNKKQKTGVVNYNHIPYDIVGLIFSYMFLNRIYTYINFGGWYRCVYDSFSYKLINKQFHTFITEHMFTTFRITARSNSLIHRLLQVFQNKKRYTDAFIKALISVDLVFENLELSSLDNLGRLSTHKPIKSLILHGKWLALSKIEEVMGFDGLRNLTLRDFRTETIEFILPHTLISLTLSALFNNEIKIDMLPRNLECLIFGNMFNSPIQIGALPKTLKRLKFGFRYDQCLPPGLLPNKLESLFIGNDYNKELVIGALPHSLKNLIFGDYIAHKLDNYRLHHWNLGEHQLDMHRLDEWGLGEQLIQPMLICRPKKNTTPPREFWIDSRRTRNKLRWFDSGMVTVNTQYQEGVLPIHLNMLVCSWTYNREFGIGVIPNSLTVLVLGFRFNKPLKVGVLPKGLKSLKFGVRFNQPIPKNLLPESLTILSFGADFKQDISDNRLPSHLKYLKLGSSCCDLNILNACPDSLEVFQCDGLQIYVSRDIEIPTNLRFIIYDNYLGQTVNGFTVLHGNGFRKKIQRDHTYYHRSKQYIKSQEIK